VPTILVAFGYRFFFFSNENSEPIHVHVQKSNAEGKVWLMPEIKPSWFVGFKVQEEREILELVQTHQELFKSKWNEHFKK
jgi:hypothetical protein